MEYIDEDFQKDIDAVGQIPIISSLLNVICQTTGMGFAAVARVTDERWVTCTVRDDIGFGLKPGDELEIKTTICNEIRQSEMAVTIDHVDEDSQFYDHHTPKQYGFQSYISVPIIRRDGSFFGTLCAIDPEPNIVSTPSVTGMFALFADLISFHLDALQATKDTKLKLEKEKAFKKALKKEVKDRTAELVEKNKSLVLLNKELEAFAYISSHDLQEPLRKIQTISSIILQTENENLSGKGKDYFKRMQDAAKRMQTLINDLLAYSRTNISEGIFESTDLEMLLNEVLFDLNDEIKTTGAKLNIGNIGTATVIPFQFRQLLYNMVGNALKFKSKNRPLQINIRNSIETGAVIGLSKLNPDAEYYHITIADNGIGFEPQYSDKIFEVFQRLHDRTHFEGTGIGLAIVKKIMDNHHGLIKATGKLDQGATFDIYIPVT
jgi:signal transduction histidine kinase